MGGIDLRAQAHPRPEVAAAVRWHYHPLSILPDDAPAGIVTGPEARVFAAVSLADKLDTLVGYFGIGEEPTGSRDPYGLRRAGQGAIRVVLDFWASEGEAKPPHLGSLIAAAVAGYGEVLELERATLESRLGDFLLDRLEFVLTSRGFPLDEVRAVVQTPGADALADAQDCLVRVKALACVRSEARDDFEHLAVAFKRASNILRGQPQADVEPELFTEAAERELHEAVARLRGQDGGYEARLRSLASLRGPVDRFFDDVLVMAEEPKVRSNRLGLLAQTLSLFYRISDISKLGGKP
jgi:glycyl-tRNA synthetase beta chain